MGGGGGLGERVGKVKVLKFERVESGGEKGMVGVMEVKVSGVGVLHSKIKSKHFPFLETTPHL